jgi:LacI family transcriptional regulator
MSVGMVIPDVENPLFGPIIAGAESVLSERGYTVIVGNTDRSAESAQTVTSSLLDGKVDGLILATANRSDQLIDSLYRQEIPTVLVNRRSDDDRFPAILVDDHAGIGLACEHLAALGHRHIGHIAGPEWLSTGQGRRRAFLSWMSELDLDGGSDRVEEADWFQVEPGYRACVSLLRRHPELTAIVAANDLLALGCYRAIQASGLEVGTGVSVTGYNDIPLLDLMQPSLTTVRVPYREMGRLGASTLLELVDSPDFSDLPPAALLQPSLIVRGSTAPTG